MFRFALCAACLVLLAGCGAPLTHRGVASTPTGTDAATGQPAVSARALGPGGINRQYNIGADPLFPDLNDGSRGR